MYQDDPLPSWFPELSLGETIYVRRDPKPGSNERYVPMVVHEIFRSEEMPNLNVIFRGREIVQNVLHIEDPRLRDANFMATATHPEAPGVGGVFILPPTRTKHEAELRSLRNELDDIRADIAALKRKRGEPVAA